MTKGTTLILFALLLPIVAFSQKNIHEAYSECQDSVKEMLFYTHAHQIEHPEFLSPKERMERKLNAGMRQDNKIHPMGLEITGSHPDGITHQSRTNHQHHVPESYLGVKQRLDSIIYTDPDGVNTRKIIINYDTQGNVTLWAHYNWNNENGEWIPFVKHENAYDANGYVTMDAVYYGNAETSEWAPDRKNYYAHDTHGNQTLRIIYNGEITTGDWIPYRKYENVFDAEGNKKFYFAYSPDNNTGEWKPGHKTVFTYDENDNRTLSRNYFFANESMEWTQTGYTEHLYSEDGYLSMEVKYVLDGNPGDFIFDFKWEYDNDSNGNQTLLATYTWNKDDGEWRPLLKDEYAYNMNDKPEMAIWYFGFSNQWMPVKKEEYEYNANGTKSLLSVYNWNGSSSEWKISAKTEYHYNDQGNMILYLNTVLHPDPSIDDWFDKHRIEWNFDNNGNEILYFQKITHFNNENQTTHNSGYRHERIFDMNYNFGDLITHLSDPNKRNQEFYYDWNSDTQEWIHNRKIDYFYSETNITNIEDLSTGNIKVYPNPVSEYLNFKISDNESGTFELFDLHGRSIVSQRITNNQQILLDDLTPGVYIFTLKVGENKETGRLVKQ